MPHDRALLKQMLFSSFQEMPRNYIPLEKQFDGLTSRLMQLAQMPRDQIRHKDLWVYYEDIAHVDLDPVLFRHLFPVCLMHWHDSLMKQHSCAVGSAEFHFSVSRKNLFANCLHEKERNIVKSFFLDSLMYYAQNYHLYDSELRRFYFFVRINSLGYISGVYPTIMQDFFSSKNDNLRKAQINFVNLITGYDDNVSNFTMPSLHYIDYLMADDSSCGPSKWLPENQDVAKEILCREYLYEFFSECVTSVDTLAGKRMLLHFVSNVERVDLFCKGLLAKYCNE